MEGYGANKTPGIIENKVPGAVDIRLKGFLLSDLSPANLPGRE